MRSLESKAERPVRQAGHGVMRVVLDVVITMICLVPMASLIIFFLIELHRSVQTAWMPAWWIRYLWSVIAGIGLLMAYIRLFRRLDA